MTELALPTIAQAKEALTQLTDVDIASMETLMWSPRALAFLKFVHKYIPDARVSGGCLWSCKNARDKARETKMTDKDVPFIRFMFNICETCPASSLIWSTAISRVHVWHLKGDVHIYLGSDKQSEASGFHIGNYLWEAELPVLQLLAREGIVKQIWLHVWEVSLDDKKMLEGKWSAYAFGLADRVPLWRREWHPLDPAEMKSSFVHSKMKQADFDMWRLTPPRTHITIGGMRRVISKWRYITQSKHFC